MNNNGPASNSYKSADYVPDFIIRDVKGNFTQIPNDTIIRNPELTHLAKMILIVLLANQDGWCSHVSTLAAVLNCGKSTIRSGLRELEAKGFLIRVPYREKGSKTIRGIHWSYTTAPWKLGLETLPALLDKHGMEPLSPTPKGRAHPEPIPERRQKNSCHTTPRANSKSVEYEDYEKPYDENPGDGVPECGVPECGVPECGITGMRDHRNAGSPECGITGMRDHRNAGLRPLIIP